MGLIINVTNYNCRIDGRLDHTIVEMLDDNMSYDVSGAHFSSKVQKGQWDGKRHLFSTGTFSFPTGLLPRVQELFTGIGMEFTINDMRRPVTRGTPLACKTVAWDWQQFIINDCIKDQRGIVKAPTGSGKGQMLIDLLGRLQVLPTVILVHKRDLVYQIKRDIKTELGIDIGQLGDGIIDIQPITIAMVQTVANAYKVKLTGFEEKDKTKITNDKVNSVKTLIETAECLIADEVHAITAPSYYALQRYFKNAFYKYGFSATPYRTDHADILLEAAFGKRIAEISCSDLIRKGFLAKPDFYLVKFKHKRAPGALNYAELYDQEVVNNENRNYVITKMATKAWQLGKKVLIIVQMRKHGELLEKMLGITIGKENVRYVHGDTDTELRQDTLTDLNSGKIRMVIATKVYSEGVNIKTLNTLINCKAQDSAVDFVQIIGRAMRKAPGKDRVCIIDIFDEGCRWLAGHSKNRLEVLKQEEEFTIYEIESDKV